MDRPTTSQFNIIRLLIASSSTTWHITILKLVAIRVREVFRQTHLSVAVSTETSLHCKSWKLPQGVKNMTSRKHTLATSLSCKTKLTWLINLNQHNFRVLSKCWKGRVVQQLHQLDWSHWSLQYINEQI